MKRKSISLSLLAALAAALPAGADVIHRYSFTADASDSVGSASGTLLGGATIDNKAVVLNGTDGYVDLPNNIVSSLNALTLETWITDTGSAGWARVWDFGTSAGGEDVSGTGLTHIFLSLPNGGGALMSDYRSSSAEQSLTIPRPPADVPVHVVWTSDPVTKLGSLYLNGALAGTLNNLNITPAQVGNTFNDWLGRSQYNDPYFKGSIDEFRIYDNAISPLQVAVDAALGPDALFTDPGTLQTVTVNAAASMDVGSVQRATVTGKFANLDGVGLSTLATYTSDNPGIIAILDATGKLGAISPGTAIITATYGGVSGTKSITVKAVPPKLLHRYSFTADATDSVGSADGALAGNAAIQDGQVVLDGVDGYVDLPNDLIMNQNSITIESWVTDNGSGGWARIFDFGNSAGGEDQGTGGTQYVFLSWPAGDGFLRGA
ncbi:MAG TPA: LamG-like jellyroll fold domain-containing protein, partial [Candidatus Limnocylindria bacterium]|nr:LamG-like jellyroll fold domain-containing protein [Candidatus Limnocylindria bacterium]